jgi:hypothetical protein
MNRACALIDPTHVFAAVATPARMQPALLLKPTHAAPIRRGARHLIATLSRIASSLAARMRFHAWAFLELEARW